MAVFNYRKFKVLLDADSKKTQGLRTGDIVRRQYFDGQNVIYSLMCVLDYGVEETVDPETEETIRRSYFIGALLEGDAPNTDQILDFVRVTSLFDTDRSGALYLTASDSHSPYMDVIDGIGMNMSLCWPRSIAGAENIDSATQYVVVGGDLVTAEYIRLQNDSSRILHLTRNNEVGSDAIGIEQEFYKYVANPQRVIVSYKIKGSSAFTAHASLLYSNELNTDGTVNVDVTTDWTYQMHAITVDYSGRHIRKLKLVIDDFANGEEVWISDFNIILQSSLSSFADASKVRVGRLDGVSDEVFGQLEGYGSYLQKLYASGSAHISGTLTAGDENGFAATFYAGKIHRNAFVNSIDVNWIDTVSINNAAVNPTGVGKVYSLSSEKTMMAQTRPWMMERIGVKYTFSFWGFAMQQCQVAVIQNGHTVGVIDIPYSDTHAWHRYKVTFEIMPPNGSADACIIAISPTFGSPQIDGINGEEQPLQDQNIFLFSAPQLEKGQEATQYQPTDSILNQTEDYGAWFSRGGIGGTIQNPLLKLNYDGNGSIGARNNSFVIRNDGSGHLANANISWDAEGNVTFGEGVVITWDNLGANIQSNLYNKSIHIIGGDTFMLVGDLSGNTSFSPSAILLTITETNLTSTSSQRAWYYQLGMQWVQIEDANGLSLEVSPTASYWGDANVLTIKAEVTIEDAVFADTITLRKEYLTGYSVEIVSSQGETFMNGQCQTVLTANVYYQGLLVDPEFVAENFVFFWRKYTLPDNTNEVSGWWQAIYDDQNNLIQPFIDRTAQSISLNCPIQGSDMYTCELQTGAGFTFTFPVVL